MELRKTNINWLLCVLLFENHEPVSFVGSKTREFMQQTPVLSHPQALKIGVAKIIDSDMIWIAELGKHITYLSSLVEVKMPPNSKFGAKCNSQKFATLLYA